MERQLVEQLDYNLLFRWFVGLGMDDAVWNHAVFSKNRDRLLTSEVAQQFFCRREPAGEARRRKLPCPTCSRDRGRRSDGNEAAPRRTRRSRLPHGSQMDPAQEEGYP
jgi:hypothetical protein